MDIHKLLIEAMGYTDVKGMARAATLMGMAQENLWVKCINEAKKLYGAEIKAAVAALRPGASVSAEISNAAVEDAVRKVLQQHDIYPYPEIIAGVLGSNPYQIRNTIPDFVSKADPTNPLKPE